MKLWVVENEAADYDELTSAVIGAEDENAAKEIFVKAAGRGRFNLTAEEVEIQEGILHQHIHYG